MATGGQKCFKCIKGYRKGLEDEVNTTDFEQAG